MSVGLVGAHRVGKTTLARLLADSTGLRFVETNSGDVFKRLGVNASSPMGFSTRMKVQEAILDHCIDLWYREKVPFFTDRTPICMLGYTTADLTSSLSLTDDEFGLYQAYKKRCFEATHRFFGQLLLIQPGIPLVDPGDKPTAAMSLPFIEHLNTLMIGLSYSTECYTPVYILPRNNLSLENRKLASLEAIQHSYQQHDISTAGRRFH